MPDANRQDLLNIVLNFGNTVLHKLCDGKIIFNHGAFVCENCNVKWNYGWIEKRATDEEINLRFKLPTSSDTGLYKLVEKDGHTTLLKLDKDELKDFVDAVNEYMGSFKW